jgi:hypothetical protein
MCNSPSIKADKSVSETVRSRIDKTMMLRDAMAVCCVAIWLLKRTQRPEKLKLLRAVADRVRHPIAHFNATANRALVDWTTCKVLVRNTVEILDWWNFNFACKVEHSFIRQLNDIAIAGQAALIQPPIIPRTEVALGQLIAGGGQSTVFAAVFRDESVAVKQFSGATLSSLAAEQKIRNELQTMVREQRVLLLTFTFVVVVLVESSAYCPRAWRLRTDNRLFVVVDCHGALPHVACCSASSRGTTPDRTIDTIALGARSGFGHALLSRN